MYVVDAAYNIIEYSRKRCKFVCVGTRLTRPATRIYYAYCFIFLFYRLPYYYYRGGDGCADVFTIIPND